MSINIKNFSFIVHVSINGTTGSGFLYKSAANLYLITAKHVILDHSNNLIGNNIVIISKDVNEALSTATIYETEMPNIQNLVFHNDPTLDIIALKIDNDQTNIINEKDRPITCIEDIADFGNLKVLASIFIGGCPTSLSIDVPDYDITRTSFRAGIISSIYEKNFIVDCPSYYGMSGGAVFVKNEDGTIQIIGIISKLVPLLVQWFNNRERAIINTDFENSGFSICIEVNDLISKLP